MISLRQLRYFTALAEHRHFSRAAEACSVSQPALSMQIKELEQELGVDLVERRPNEIILTDIGAEVAHRAEQVLAATRDLSDFARHRQQPLTGLLKLGIIPSIAPYVLPKLLPVLQRRCRELRLELRETQTRILLDELSRGSLDVVMLALPVDEPDVEAVKVFDDPFLLAVPASDERPENTRVRIGDIDQQRLILLEEGHCLRDQALALCASKTRNSTLGATSLATVMQMVANNHGVTLLPQIAADEEFHDERVKLLRFIDPPPGRTVGLAWRKTSPRKLDFLALRQMIAGVMKGRRA